MVNMLNGQIALVTGGGTGIGRGICIDLAIKGANVIITGRRMDKLEETKREIDVLGGTSECYILDVSSTESITEVVSKVNAKYKKIDILVSNAGNLSAPSFMTDMPSEDWDSVLKTHLYGAFEIIKQVAKGMKERKYGRIVIIGSVAGIDGFSGAVNYAVSKAGLEGMSKTLAKELGPFGVTANCIQPGIIKTPMADDFIAAIEEKIVNDTPVRKIGSPQDVANAVSFFCMPESHFITGVIMKVDGGYMLSSSMDQFMFSNCMK